MKLLLIDDNELDRQAIIRTFKKTEWDITIAQACSASDGLAQFDSNDFDAVLLDYRLPDIDGMEVLQLLSKHPHHHAAIIILTGASADDDLEREFIEAGAQDVLFKSEIAHKHLTRAITHARARHLLERQLHERIRLEKELRALIPTDHFILFYQPIVDAHTFEICGAEGLIRWNHPTRGILPPSEFITLAEEIGLISEIDSKSRLNACKQLASWRAQHLVDDNFNMKFNICAQLLTDEDLYQSIINDLASTGVPGRCVSLEITESVLIENLERTAKSLKKIQDYGVEIAVDDFGTGYSSMAYLKELPARTLKIDRKFIQGVPDNAADCRILRAMIVFAKSLDLTVVVEGVETREQARICRDYGADLLQGYLFSKPLSPTAFEHVLTNHNAQEWVLRLSTLGTNAGS